MLILGYGHLAQVDSHNLKTSVVLNWGLGEFKIKYFQKLLEKVEKIN